MNRSIATIVIFVKAYTLAAKFKVPTLVGLSFRSYQSLAEADTLNAPLTVSSS